MKTLLVDVDEVICHPTLIDEINKFLHTNYRLTDFTEYYIDDVLGSDENKQKFYEIIKNKNMYEDAVLLDGVTDALKKLSKEYDIYICSACAMFCLLKESGIYFKYKYDFLIKNFPFLNPEHFIFTGGKNIFKADAMIDDRPKNLMGDIGTRIMMLSYHNRDISDEELKKNNIIKVSSWAEIENILLDKN